MAKVTCKICKNKIEKNEAYVITKINEKTNKKTNSYYCSKEEFEKDKYLKSLWQKLLISIDDILGYTCVSKVKVNELKELEKEYTREQIYNCIENNKEEIKRYLEMKNIQDEYGKISYIFACIRNKIKDDTANFGTTEINTNDDIIINLKYEDDNDIFERLERQRRNADKNSNNIFKIIDNKKKGDK